MALDLDALYNDSTVDPQSMQGLLLGIQRDLLRKGVHPSQREAARKAALQEQPRDALQAPQIDVPSYPRPQFTSAQQDMSPPQTPAVSFIRRPRATDGGAQAPTTGSSTPPVSFLPDALFSDPTRPLGNNPAQAPQPESKPIYDENGRPVLKRRDKFGNTTPVTPPVSFITPALAAPGQPQPSPDPSRLQPGDLDRYLSQSNPADPNTEGTPRVSFLGPAPAGAGSQDAEAAKNNVASGTSATNIPNAGALMRAASQPNPGIGGTQQRSLEDEYRELLKSEPDRSQFPARPMGFWKKLLGGALSVAAGAGGGGEVAGDVANRFFTSPQRKAEAQFEQAHQGWEGKVGNLLRAAKLRHDDLEDRNLQSEIDKRDKDKPDNPTDKKIDEGYNKEGQRVHVYQRRDGTEYTKVFSDIVQKQGSPEHKTPFEAYAYGTPDEKQSAQDFLDMEHKFQRKYSNPSEFEERYKLFKEEPETYRGMFGDKSGSGPDAANATRMLGYFDRRRREVQGDFTLDDNQKQEQLQEIEKLEKPFMDAAQPGNRRGGNEDRVTVTHPDGRTGTIPRSQIDKAKKKGYRVQQ